MLPQTIQTGFIIIIFAAPTTFFPFPSHKLFYFDVFCVLSFCLAWTKLSHCANELLMQSRRIHSPFPLFFRSSSCGRTPVSLFPSETTLPTVLLTNAKQSVLFLALAFHFF
jgi:hypothetical protein